MIIKLTESIIAKTILELQAAGDDGKERVVLWLGKRDSGAHEIYVPEQYAERDMFHIPRTGISELLKYLRKTNQQIISQVHSHPFKAFHSLADDRWAIVRHVGAFSIVLPYFASRTNVATFFEDAAVFQLSEKNKWIEIGKGNAQKIFQIEI